MISNKVLETIIITCLTNCLFSSPIESHSEEFKTCDHVQCNLTNEVCNPKSLQCVKYGQVGQECDPEFDLCNRLANGYCNVETSKCVLNVPEGGFCELNGLVCNIYKQLTCLNNICQRNKENLDRCNQNDDMPCKPGFVCHPEKLICFASLNLGDFCDKNFDLCTKSEGLFCDKTYGFCVRYLSEAEYCSPEYSLCSPGYHCDKQSFKCTRLSSYMGLCNQDKNLCDSLQGLTCNLNTSKCDGNIDHDSCDQSNPCQHEDFFCHAEKSICVRYYEAGNMCDFENEFCNPKKNLLCDFDRKICTTGLELGMQCQPERDTCVKGKNLKCHSEYKICFCDDTSEFQVEGNYCKKK